MLFSNYQLEILVNDKPLEECVEPLEAGKTTTGPSYSINEVSRKKIESDQTVYAAVTEPGVQFKIRYKLPFRTICREPVMAFVYVDGQHDNTYSAHTSLASVQNTRESFYNYARGKVYNFKFDITLWSNEGSVSSRASIGGQGAVSVYFYRAMHLRQNVIPADIEIRSAKVSENQADLGLKLSTSFSEKPMSIQPMHESLLAPTSSQPLAVLHLHYRAASWLMARKLLVRPIPLPITRNAALSEVKSNDARATKTENTEDVIRQIGKTREQDPRGIKRRNSEQRMLDDYDTENVIIKIENDNEYVTIKTEIDDQRPFELSKRRK